MAALYAQELYGFFGADAATVSPYLGWDAVAPYTVDPERGAIVLCHTSNPGSPWLQDHPETSPTYLRIAERVAREDRGNLMLVVGATFPEQLAEVRQAAPSVPFLVPGVGAQSGDLAAVFANGLDAEGAGLVVNASRSVIFAGSGDGWLGGVESAAIALRDDMRRARDVALAAKIRGDDADRAAR